MSILIKESELAEALPPETDVVQLAYPDELAEIASKLLRGLPALVECDKDLALFVYMNLKERLKSAGFQLIAISGSASSQKATEKAAAGAAAKPGEKSAGPSAGGSAVRGEEQQGGMPVGLLGSMINQLKNVIRGGALQKKVVALMHLDLMTTSQGGLTTEAREVIALLYENPDLVWLGFKDPTFSLPRVIENLFLHRTSLVGISRGRLRYLVTQKESRKFGRDFNPWALYKHVSGVNAVRLRKLLSTLEGEDYPADPKHAFRQLRQATLVGQLEIPNIDLDLDIGGYKTVKKRLRAEILDVLAHKETVVDAEEITRLEELLPKGMICWGPPGTGKTLFAKAMAAAIGAAITIVSGPELKSKWVGESEENLRRIFYQARQSAPSIIVFDELDSFATARGTYTGSGVEHSMVNQLLTEMDGFHREEMVFVVGTTNFVESLDPALLRPGRFEFHLYIPYPEADDRREILQIYDRKMRLQLTPEAVDYAVKRTGEQVIGAAAGTRYSGDHINALCRAVARIRLRTKRTGPTEAKDVEQALTEWIERPKMTQAEERVLATHEAGHAVVALFCPQAPPIDRITIASDAQWAFGYVRYDDPAHKYIQTRGFLLDLICVALGAREAELLLLDDLSVGATSDLAHATYIAREMVEVLGLGGDGVGVARYRGHRDDSDRHASLSPAMLEILDRRVHEILEEQRRRAAGIISENRQLIETLRDLLLEHKTIDAKRLSELRVSAPSGRG